MSKRTTIRTGGYDPYSIRSATLVEGYFPGPQRINLIQDPDLALGKYDPGTFWADDMIMNGPGSIQQAIPDASKYSYDRIFAIPTGNPYREFGVDSRQIASYQVEQLHNNPLSQYTTNPAGEIPGFDCLEEPDNFSTMVNKRESELKEYANDTYGPKDWLQGTTGGQNVYEQYTGKTINPNASIVYNMSMNYAGDVNPMISLGSSSRARSEANFSGKCYSGSFIPGQIINNQGGNNPPKVYNNTYYEPKTSSDIGLMNKNNKDNICIPDKSLSFANPLILNNYN